MAKINIKKYVRRSPKGKVIKVVKHKRKIRSLGKKIKFKKVGEFFVGIDEKGNLRGSRIQLTKAAQNAKKKREAKVRRRRPQVFRSLPELDRAFQLGRITPADYIDASLRLSGRN